MYIVKDTVFVPFVKIPEHVMTSRQFAPRTEEDIKTFIKTEFDNLDIHDNNIIVTPNTLVINHIDYHVVYLVDFI